MTLGREWSIRVSFICSATAVGICGSTLVEDIHGESAAAAQETMPDAPMPIAVLWLKSFLVHDLELRFLPELALYDNGRVFYLQRGDDGKTSPMTAVLSGKELARARQMLAPSEAFARLEDMYDLLPCMLDGPTAEVYLADGEHEKRVSVRGYFWQDDLFVSYLSPCARIEPTQVPEEFDRLVREFLRLDLPDGERWRPTEYRVYLRRWDYRASVAKEPVEWPRGWRPLRALKDRCEREGRYTVFVDAREVSTLLRLYDAAENKHPIMIEEAPYELSYDPYLQVTRYARSPDCDLLTRP